jgi:hypothetical protein
MSVIAIAPLRSSAARGRAWYPNGSTGKPTGSASTISEDVIHEDAIDQGAVRTRASGPTTLRTGRGWR